MKKLLYILSVNLLIMSCESNEDYKYKILQRQTELLRQRAIIDTLIKPVEVILDKQLLDAKVKCLGDGMCENFEEYEKFSEKQFTKKELKDAVLTVECYFLRSGCTGYEGNIRINLDTLILKLESNTNTSCTEIEYYKVIYKINNPKRKKYIIAKE